MMMMMSGEVWKLRKCFCRKNQERSQNYLPQEKNWIFKCTVPFDAFSHEPFVYASHSKQFSTFSPTLPFKFADRVMALITLAL